MPTPAALFGLILFGAIGMAAFVYGKKNASPRALVIGLILMIYPYFVQATLPLFLIGAALTAALFVFRE